MKTWCALLSVYWKPASVAQDRISWLLPFGGSATLLILFGLMVRSRVTGLVLARFKDLGFSQPQLDLIGRGSYYGVVITGLLLPLLIPWIAAFVSKIIALLVGSRTTFGHFYYLYQWGYYLSTPPTILLKGVLFWKLPVSLWGSVTLSLGALVSWESPRLKAVFATLDVPLLMLFAFAILGLRTAGKRGDSLVPVWTLAAFVLAQCALILT